MPNDFRKGPPRLTDAVEPIASGSKPHEMIDPEDIADALAILAENGDAISIYPSSSTEVVMARIASVDRERFRFVIQLNEGNFLPPGEATFVTWLRSAKFQFKLHDPHWNSLAEQPTLIPAEFPDKCIVLNRRAAARLETPLGTYHTASFVLNGKPYEMQLYDFAAGGIGMRCAPREAVGLHVGRKLQRVRLEMGPQRVIICDLEIRLSRHYRSFLLGEQVQIGCQFINVAPHLRAEIDQVLEQLNGARRR